MAKIKYTIRFGASGDPNITKLTSTAADRFEDVYKFQVPKSMDGILLQAGDTISAFIASNTGSEIARPDGLFEIEFRDASDSNTIKVFGPANYDYITEFQDKTKKARLIIDEPILVQPLQFIVFRISDDVAMVQADIDTNTFGELNTTRVFK